MFNDKMKVFPMNLKMNKLFALATFAMVASVGCNTPTDNPTPTPPVPTGTWNVTFVDSMSTDIGSTGLSSLCNSSNGVVYNVYSYVDRNFVNASGTVVTSQTNVPTNETVTNDNTTYGSNYQDQDCNSYSVSLVNTDDLTNSTPNYGANNNNAFAVTADDPNGRCITTVIGTRSARYLRLDISWKGAVESKTVNGIIGTDANNRDVTLAYDCTANSDSTLSVSNSGRRILVGPGPVIPKGTN
jgi:hypothetical protein